MPVEAKNSKFFYIFNSPIILHFRQDFPLGPVLLLLNNPKPIPSWSLLRELVSQADGQLLFQGSGKVWTVFQIACQGPLLAREAPRSSGHLKGLDRRWLQCTIRRRSWHKTKWVIRQKCIAVTIQPVRSISSHTSNYSNIGPWKFSSYLVFGCVMDTFNWIDF